MNRDEQRQDTIANPDTVVIRDTTGAGASDTNDETAEIRANIEHTRAEMSETINALQDRLSPTTLKEQAKETVREQFEETKHMVREATVGRVENIMHNASDTVNDARYTMMDTIKENPIPAALVGIGLGWLFMNRSSKTPTRYSGRGGVRGRESYRGGSRPYNERQMAYNTPYMYDDQGRYREVESYRGGQQGGMMERAQDAASNATSRVQETASNLTDRAQETASNLTDRVQETASNLTDRAQYQAQRVEDRVQDSLRRNPLAVGAVALALGTAIGLAIPETQKEHELMGEARDNLLDRAQEMAQGTVERVQQVASEVTSDAKQTVKEQAKEQGLTS